jgi:hypothetical protein
MLGRGDRDEVLGNEDGKMERMARGLLDSLASLLDATTQRAASERASLFAGVLLN